jgi:acetyl esterase
MEFPTTVHPIHPIYQSVCDEHKKQLALAFEAQQASNTEITPEVQYKMITEVRRAADEFAKKFPVPETIQAKQEVFGGPKKLKVGTTVFRPVSTENEILPVILYL